MEKHYKSLLIGIIVALIFMFIFSWIFTGFAMSKIDSPWWSYAIGGGIAFLLSLGVGTFAGVMSYHHMGEYENYEQNQKSE